MLSAFDCGNDEMNHPVVDMRGQFIAQGSQAFRAETGGGFFDKRLVGGCDVSFEVERSSLLNALGEMFFNRHDSQTALRRDVFDAYAGCVKTVSFVNRAARDNRLMRGNLFACRAQCFNLGQA